MKKVLTLGIVHQQQKVLLGYKKRGFGAGKWNGFGGKVEDGEEVFDAARREIKEEAGIDAIDLDRLGIVNFRFRGKPEILEVHIFKAKNFEGEVKESDEMKPQWFDIKEIPFHAMWPDDKHWIPLFLEDRKFRGKFLFDESEKILDYSLTLV